MNYTLLSDFCTFTRIMTKKYHIPELKWTGIPYTQNPWPGLNYATDFHSPFISSTVIPLFGIQYFLLFQSCIQVTFKFSQILNNLFGERSMEKTGELSIFCQKIQNFLDLYDCHTVAFVVQSAGQLCKIHYIHFVFFYIY